MMRRPVHLQKQILPLQPSRSLRRNPRLWAPIHTIRAPVSGRCHCHTDRRRNCRSDGIPLSGRKEIILSGHTLTLTGAYGVSPDAVLDIKPGEVEVGTINLTELTFDFGFLSEELPPEKALVEIRPGVTIGGEPQYPEGVSIREFPDILTVIQCD